MLSRWKGAKRYDGSFNTMHRIRLYNAVIENCCRGKLFQPGFFSQIDTTHLEHRNLSPLCAFFFFIIWCWQIKDSSWHPCTGVKDFRSHQRATRPDLEPGWRARHGPDDKPGEQGLIDDMAVWLATSNTNERPTLGQQGKKNEGEALTGWRKQGAKCEDRGQGEWTNWANWILL